MTRPRRGPDLPRRRRRSRARARRHRPNSINLSVAATSLPPFSPHQPYSPPGKPESHRQRRRHGPPRRHTVAARSPTHTSVATAPHASIAAVEYTSDYSTLPPPPSRLPPSPSPHARPPPSPCRHCPRYTVAAPPYICSPPSALTTPRLGVNPILQSARAQPIIFVSAWCWCAGVGGHGVRACLLFVAGRAAPDHRPYAAPAGAHALTISHI